MAFRLFQLFRGCNAVLPQCSFSIQYVYVWPCIAEEFSMLHSAHTVWVILYSGCKRVFACSLQLGYTSIFDQFDAALKIHLWESKQKVSICWFFATKVAAIFLYSTLCLTALVKMEAPVAIFPPSSMRNGLNIFYRKIAGLPWGKWKIW